MQKIKDQRWVAFDLETSSAYPVGGEIIEFGAVLMVAGKIERSLQLLCCPRQPLTPENSAIHGITNADLAGKPRLEEVLVQMKDFLFLGEILFAHHAPFDLGFLAHSFEETHLEFPAGRLICTSLLAQAVIPESPNHRLQTLVQYLALNQGQAHRALDDARACAEVAQRCMDRLGDPNFDEVQMKCKLELLWKNFSLRQSGYSFMGDLITAIQNRKDIKFNYGADEKKPHRVATPLGVVRNPKGDFIQALCHIDRVPKRFYLSKLSQFSVVEPVLLL